ncbi:unnamed protein product [Cochlearia groenlandica]
MRPLSDKTRLHEVSMHDTSSSSVYHRVAPPQSLWHSPVPYLFGGLAAMLGLIAFALLILACSYWRISGEESGRNGEGIEEERQKKDKAEKGAYEEKFMVIMAGENLPRFLATPAMMKKCTCGGHEGKTVIIHDDSVLENDVKVRDGEVKDTREPITSH